MTNPNPRDQIEARINGVLGPEHRLRSVFYLVDPYSPTFGRDLIQALEAQVAGDWRALSAQIPGLSPLDLLRNCWAAVAASPGRLATLYRAAATSGDPAVAAMAELLRSQRPIGATDEPLLAQLLANSMEDEVGHPPSLATCLDLAPGIRVRYALAHAWRGGTTSAANLLEVAASASDASAFVVAREFRRLLERAAIDGKPLTPIGDLEFQVCRKKSHEAVLSDPVLRRLVLPDSMASDPDLRRKLEASRQQHTLCIRLVRELDAAVGRYDFASAEEITARIYEMPLAVTLAPMLLKEPSRGRFSRQGKVSGKAAWHCLSAKAAGMIAALRPGLESPEWWTLGAAEIARKIATGDLSLADLGRAFPKIAAGWSQSELRVLADAGRWNCIPIDSPEWDRADLALVFRASAGDHRGAEIVRRRLSALPDVRPVLGLLARSDQASTRKVLLSALRFSGDGFSRVSFEDWIVPALGTAEWKACDEGSRSGERMVESALRFLESGNHPLDPDGFHAEIVRLLTALKSSVPRLFASYLNRADCRVADLLASTPEARLVRLLGSSELHLPALNRMRDYAPRSLQDRILHVSFGRVRTAAELTRLLRDHCGKAGRIPWRDSWMELRGTDSQKAMALILASRRDPQRLRRIAGKFRPVFDLALEKAILALGKKSRRDRGFLELLGVLGVDSVMYLAAVLSMCRKEAPAGSKLDHTYRTYRLPKKSGGTRLISVPDPKVKRIQRLMLDRLVEPLGAHEAAFGFVRGRSIRGNASLHVGQPIVSNADVRNCFPSVKWPLVLGVARRDLGTRLSEAGISLLVDVCTSDGGLPIGAPTSPALLNRVLLRTDEYLHAAASRLGCRYSRYADDLTFSGDHGAVRLLGIAKRTLSQIGLQLDPKKTNIFRRGRRQMVTGLVVNSGVSVPRRLRRRLRAAIHAVENGRDPKWHGKSESLAALAGRLHFVHSVNPEHATKLLERLQRATG
jgi:retron-type reverse transcriptase